MRYAYRIHIPLDKSRKGSKWFTTRHDTTGTGTETDYEKKQRFNFLVSYLHSLRYKNILTPFISVAQEIKDKPIHVVDIGCAHAKLFSVLNERFDIHYTGIEVWNVFVEAARSRYAHHRNFRVIHDSVMNALQDLEQKDVIVALETFEHMPEHDVVRVIEAIAAAKPRFFICSVPVEIGPVLWLKNIVSFMMGYTRHKEYFWHETFWAGCYQLDKLPPHDTGHKGFDWRWLAQTIRHNMKITHFQTFPFNILPTAAASSVFIIAEPRTAIETSLT